MSTATACQNHTTHPSTTHAPRRVILPGATFCLRVRGQGHHDNRKQCDHAPTQAEVQQLPWQRCLTTHVKVTEAEPTDTVKRRKHIFGQVPTACRHLSETAANKTLRTSLTMTFPLCELFSKRPTQMVVHGSSLNLLFVQGHFDTCRESRSRNPGLRSFKGPWPWTRNLYTQGGQGAPETQHFVHIPLPGDEWLFLDVPPLC